jgi:hypothetical protein
VWSGGPYIPDDPSLGVEEIVIAGRRDAITMWPNPASDELHIAWRGDLGRMPSWFAVHDMLGREVAHGAVESWRGEALWSCAGVAAGVYVISMYDADDALITTGRIIKE